MRGEPALLNAITQLYAATLARDDWGAVLEQVRDAFAGHHVILAMHDLGSGAVPFAASVGIERENEARFLSTDAVRRSAPIYGAFPMDTALPRSALISDGDFARSDFYDEFVRPMQGFHSVGAVLRGPDQFTASINICRPERAGAYDLPDATALQLMLPHVAMALEIQARMRAANRSYDLERLLDCFAIAALVCDSSGRPGFMNARAQALFAAGDGLSLCPTGLAAATPKPHAGAARRHRARGGGRRDRWARRHPPQAAAPVTATGAPCHAHADIASRSRWCRRARHRRRDAGDGA